MEGSTKKSNEVLGKVSDSGGSDPPSTAVDSVPVPTSRLRVKKSVTTLSRRVPPPPKSRGGGGQTNRVSRQSRNRRGGAQSNRVPPPKRSSGGGNQTNATKI